jgi:hypothetical protein
MGNENLQDLYFSRKLLLPPNTVNYQLDLVDREESYKIIAIQIDTDFPISIYFNSITNDLIQIPSNSYLRIDDLEYVSALSINTIFFNCVDGATVNIVAIKSLY